MKRLVRSYSWFKGKFKESQKYILAKLVNIHRAIRNYIFSGQFTCLGTRIICFTINILYFTKF